MAGYRADPLAAAVNRWYARTEHVALRALAKKHRGEYMKLLFEIREADPKPEAEDGGQQGEAADAAA